jgi:hypothetical protein
VKTLIGLALAALSLALFAAVEQRSAGTELSVELTGARTGDVPAAIADRVERDAEPDAPGLRRTRWRVAYRGDHVREVGATELVGPFQAPGACGGRVVVGQTLLDELAPITAELVARQLAGTSIVGLGAFVRVDGVSLRWARLETHLADAALVAGARAYVRAAATVHFEHATAPVTLVLVPLREGEKLRFRVAVHAELHFANRVLEWLSRKLPTDELATEVAGDELDAALVTTLAPPPPIVLGDGQTLAFTYCDGPFEVEDGAWGALPFAVVFDGAPVHFAAGPRTPPRADTKLALDLDVDALNAMLFELWRTKWLDRRLADAGLDRKFAEDATVARYLSVRVGSPTLALPPVLEPAGDHLRLAADARIAIVDGAVPTITSGPASLATIGRLFGTAELRFPAAVKLAPLELACERGARTLVPCYADLITGLAARSPDFDGALAERLDALVRSIFTGRRLPLGDVPVTLGVRGASVELAPGARGVHVELDAELLK